MKHALRQKTAKNASCLHQSMTTLSVTQRCVPRAKVHIVARSCVLNQCSVSCGMKDLQFLNASHHERCLASAETSRFKNDPALQLVWHGSAVAADRGGRPSPAVTRRSRCVSAAPLSQPSIRSARYVKPGRVVHATAFWPKPASYQARGTRDPTMAPHRRQANNVCCTMVGKHGRIRRIGGVASAMSPG